MKTCSIFFMVLGLGLAGCAPPEVPRNPSWDQDVFPILQGSCNHCHGGTVGSPAAVPLKPGARLDICDPEPFKAAGIPVPATLTGASINSLTFSLFLKPPMGSSRAQMPPPPAAELSDYERDVLLRWGSPENTDRCRRQGRNRRPEMRVIGDPEWNGNDLNIEIEVWDPDRDQVLGKVSVGQVSTFIPSAGRQVITVSGGNRADPVTVLLHDGVDENTIDVDL